MKIVTYLINLDGSSDRLTKASQQLDAQGVLFERFPAYDGRGAALSDFKDYDDMQTQKNLGRSLINSEVGCYLSHYGCVEKFLTTDADYLIVLEDDVVLSQNFSKNVMALLSYLDEHRELGWYLINLAAKKRKLTKKIVKIEDFILHYAYYFPIRGVGLIWSRQGAAEFVKIAKPICYPVDVLFQRWLSENGKGLLVWSRFVSPAGLDSDILGTVAADETSRKEKENRQSSYNWKKQKRMLQDKIYAVKHLFL